MSTVRVYKVASILDIASQDVIVRLRRDHGIDVKSASSSIEEVVARQFIERVAKELGISISSKDPLSKTLSKPALKAKKRKVAALKIEGNKSTLYSLESFIWTTCLLSSRGNLSIDCNKDKLYLLKAWPDFARIEHFPFVMKIAARWHYESCTLSDLSKDMDVPQHYINSFFNGASGLSLFEDDQAKIAAQKKVKPRKKMGIIARLFSRLTIGGKNST